MLNLQNNTPLTLAQIATQAPAVVEQNSHPRVSERYVHVPTTVLISDMEKLGWNVTAVDQQFGKDRERNKFAKHMVVFRNEEIVLKTEDGETVYPQILITNSHNGMGAFKFNAGLFRVACSNGLVVSTENFGSLTIRHRGYSFEELSETLTRMVNELPATVEVLNRFRQVELTEEQKIEFALGALGIRFGKEGAVVEPSKVLKPTRQADAGNSLWAVYNVIQERMIQGGFDYKTESGRNKTARRVKSFSRDLQVNQELFALAEAYA